MRILLPFLLALSLPRPLPVSVAGPAVMAPEVQVRYLGANGWAVTVGQKLLIFDYQETTDPAPPPVGQRDLAHGYVVPGELRGQDVYVFVTHSHFDHYDSVIHEWAKELDRVHYVFGWEAGAEPAHYYLDERRERAKIGDVEVYTIYSHHTDVPEVAYLVRIGDVVIYHNGDYRADYEADFRYLRTLTDHIDVAFLIGHPAPEHPYFRQALRLAELFRIRHLFPMNREDEPSRCRDYARMLKERGVSAQIHVAERRGESFSVAP